MMTDAILGRANPWAELFDPGRKALGRSLWDYVKENADYPYYLIRDRFAGAEEPVAARGEARPGTGHRTRRGQGGGLPRPRRFAHAALGDLHPHGLRGSVESGRAHAGIARATARASRTSGDVISGPAESPLEAVK